LAAILKILQEKETAMTDKNKNDLSKEFDSNAAGVAYQFSLDYNDVRNAYQGQPESLKSVFNSMEDARDGRNRNIGWSIVWAIVCPPFMIVSGYYLWDYQEKFSALRQQVHGDVAKAKSLPGPAASSKALPPPPPKAE
jgi:hypothetical protein